MSFCPTKDIHSVYLDDELPLSYVKEYEIHVQNCSKCKSELENLKKLRSLMRQENDAMNLSKKDLDESFIRLQMKLNYTKRTRPVRSSKIDAIKYAIPAMAAAAVFALVLPIGLKTKAASNPVVPEITQNVPVATASLGNESNVILSGNIPGGAVITTTPIVSSHQKTKKNTILDVDVFRPNFDNEDTISIKITIPGISTNPYTTEIELPVDLFMGTFE